MNGAAVTFQKYLLVKLKFSKNLATFTNRAWLCCCYLCSFGLGYLADTSLGSIKTAVCSSVLYLSGFLVLAASSLPEAEDYSLLGFILATFICFPAGVGGYATCLSTLLGEQSEIHRRNQDNLEEEASSGESNLMLESTYRYYYMALNIGCLLGSWLCPYISITYSFTMCYLVSLMFFLASTFTLYIALCCFHRSHKEKAESSILAKVVKCIIYAKQQQRIEIKPQVGGEDKEWLDYAKTSSTDKPWNDEFVDNLKKTWKGFRMFWFFPFYFALLLNMSDNFINQAVNMKHPKWLDEAQLYGLESLTIVICIPLFDCLIFPFLRNHRVVDYHGTGPISYNRRILTGSVLIISAFIYVTFLQWKLYNSPPYYDFTHLKKLSSDEASVKLRNDVELWWQIPPYILIGMSEVFVTITGYEIAYRETSVAEMKNMMMGFFLLTPSGGTILGLIVSIWSHDPNFVWVFGVQATLFGLVMITFWYFYGRNREVLKPYYHP